MALKVAASEHNLLMVTLGLVGRVPAQSVEMLVCQGRALPETFGSTSIGLLKDILGRGVLLQLARRGGHVHARHLCDGKVVSGRLWERWSEKEVKLHFSPISVQVLRWVVESELAREGRYRPFDPKSKSVPTAADELVFYLVCDLVQRCGLSEPLAKSKAFRRSVLCWLGFANTLSCGGPPSKGEIADNAFDAWMERPAVMMIESLQQDLARKWLAAERSKVTVTDPERMVGLGQAQLAVLERFCAACDRQNRRDLVAFVFKAAGELLRPLPTGSVWVSRLSRRSALAVRSAACQNAGAFLAGLNLAHRWIEEARGVRFFDDAYEPSQLLLKLWEEVGNEGHEHALRVMQELTSLTSIAAPQS